LVWTFLVDNNFFYQGTWTAAKPVSLKWIEAKVNTLYSWEPTLNFIDIENALRNAIGFEYNSKIASEISCGSQEAITKLSSLLCDCFGDAKSGVCYTDSKTTEAYFFVCTNQFDNQTFEVSDILLIEKRTYDSQSN